MVDLGFWIPVLVVTGLVVFGLMFAFTAICDYI
jgi:uncharacterized membrane protein YesL